MLRFFRYILEILAALVGVAVVCGLLLVWKLHSLSADPAFLTPYIAAAIESRIPGSKVVLNNSKFGWDSDNHVLSLRVESVSISDIAGSTIAHVPSIDTKMSLVGMLWGQFTPKELVVHDPTITLIQKKGGEIAFGGMVLTKAGKGGLSATSPFAMAKQMSRTVFFRKLALTGAKVEVKDAQGKGVWTISVPEASIKRSVFDESEGQYRIGSLEGRVKAEVVQTGGDSAKFTGHYVYDPLRQTHEVEVAVDNLNPARTVGGEQTVIAIPEARMVDLPLTGKAAFIFDQKEALLKASAKIQSGEGVLANDGFWDAPCPVKKAEAEIAYDKAKQKLTISDARVDFGGTKLTLRVDGNPAAQKGYDMDFVAKIGVEKLPMNRFADIWPKPVMPNPREWLTANLRDGMFDLAEAELKGSVTFDDIANAAVVSGRGKISASGGTVTYVDGMPPVQDVGAVATFDLEKMDVQITGGGIGNIRLSPFAIRISGLDADEQHIDIPMQVSGPLPEILALLDNKPMEYAKALGVAPDELAGHMSGRVMFGFPLLKSLEMKDVGIEAVADATDVASDKLINGLPFDQGSLALKLDTDGFGLKGRIALAKTPFQIVWDERFEQKQDVPLRRVTAKGSLDQEGWNHLGLSAFNGTKGTIGVSIEMTKQEKDKILLQGALDMTAADLVVDMLAWKKPADVPAVLTFSAQSETGKPVVVSSIELKGEKVSAKGDAVLSADMTSIQSLKLSPLVVARTNASLSYARDAKKNGALKIDIKGTSLDVSGLGNGGGEPKTKQAEEYKIKVNHLYTSENGQIDKVQLKAVRDSTGWTSINLQGLADTDMPIVVELGKNDKGIRFFKASCDDFGKAMKGLGLTDTIKKGKMSIYGQGSAEAPQVIRGSLKASQFVVEKLPILARLLNATSPFGLASFFTDKTDFSLLKGNFVWSGEEITLIKTRASGSSFGINVEGKIDLGADKLDLQGTIVPLSVMNDVLNHIPLIGSLITGGKGQGVLAVSYKIGGSLDDPQVSVNPVSLLTPGFIRNIFFGDDMTED